MKTEQELLLAWMQEVNSALISGLEVSLPRAKALEAISDAYRAHVTRNWTTHKKEKVERITAPKTWELRDAHGTPVPVFLAKAVGRFFYPVLNKATNTHLEGCHLIFICPRCGSENAHGGQYNRPGEGDGHRQAHCNCWPDGYYIEEIT